MEYHHEFLSVVVPCLLNQLLFLSRVVNFVDFFADTVIGSFKFSKSAYKGPGFLPVKKGGGFILRMETFHWGEGGWVTKPTSHWFTQEQPWATPIPSFQKHRAA
jgi:hypothetical protein